MKNTKNILLHAIPVVVLALGAVFGLTSEEQNALTQGLTTIIVSVFAVVPIVLHMKLHKSK